MLTLLIPGPSSLGNYIDMFVHPLIYELKDLWLEGVVVRDSMTIKNFKL